MSELVWVDVAIHIRKNDTGEIRVRQDQIWLSDDDVPDPYIWEDGNYSCDCNRRLFFARANGDEEDWDSGCGEGEYSARVFYKGERVYSDFEEDK